MYLLMYIQGNTGKFMAVSLETNDKKIAWKKVKKMRDIAIKRGFRWKSYKILFDDGYITTEVYRQDESDSPLITNR